MAGKARDKYGLGKKLKHQQVTNKELYNVAGGVPTQASSSVVSAGSQGGGTYQNVQGADIYMNTYDIVDVDRIKMATKEGAGDSLGATDTGIDSLFSGSTSYGMKIQIPMDTANVFQIMRGTTEVFNANELSTIIGGGEGDLIALSGNVQIGADYLQMGGMVSPTNPPVNSRRIFVDTDNSDHLTVRKSDGTEVDLEAGGWTGSATSDLDMNTYDIIDVDRLQFTSDSGEGRDQDKVEMYANANTPEDAIINHPASSKIRFTEDGQQYLTFGEQASGIGIILPPNDSSSSAGLVVGDATHRPYAIWSRTMYVEGGGAGVDGTLIGLNFANNAGVNCGGSGYAFTSIWDGLEDLGRSGNYWNDLYTKEINLKEKLTIADTSANPASNGQFTRNGNDVKVYTGGGVKNLSDIGSGGGGWDGDATSALDMNGYAISSAGQIDATIITASGISFFDSTVYFAGRVDLGNGSTDDINLNGKLDVNNNYTDGTYGFAPLPVGYIELTVGTTARRLYYYAG